MIQHNGNSYLAPQLAEAKEDLAITLGIPFDLAQMLSHEALLEEFVDRFGPRSAWPSGGKPLPYTDDLFNSCNKKAGRSTAEDQGAPTPQNFRGLRQHVQMANEYTDAMPPYIVTKATVEADAEFREPLTDRTEFVAPNGIVFRGLTREQFNRLLE